jgi:ribonuclease HI
MDTRPSPTQQRQSINLLQINVNNCISATDLVRVTAESSDVDVILVQEPYTTVTTVNSHKLHKLSGWPVTVNTFPNPLPEKPRTAIILVSKDFDFTPLPAHTSTAQTTVRLQGRGHNIILISVYFKPGADVADDLQRLDQTLATFTGEDILVSGDFNAKSSVWGGDVNDERGDDVLDLISSRSLHLLNDATSPATFCNTQDFRSWVDLTLVSNRLTNFIDAWHVDTSHVNSDHRLIRTVISTDRSYPVTSNTRFCTAKAKWHIFDASLQTSIDTVIPDISTIHTAAEVEEYVNAFQVAVSEACHASIPLKTPRQRTVPWWTPGLQQQRQAVRRARRRYRRQSSPDAFQFFRRRYLDLQHAYLRHLQQARNESWKAFCSASGDNPFGVIYKLCSKKLKLDRPLTSIKLPDGSLTTTAEEGASALMDVFFPSDDSTTDTDAQAAIRESSHQLTGVEDDLPFTLSEVEDAVTSMNPKKAPGIDNVPADVVRHVFNRHPRLILDLFNRCLELSVFPSAWKQSVLKVIPKPDRQDLTSPSTYRPICLIPVIGKVLDKLMINRILYQLRVTNQLRQSQFGFTPQTSTVDAIRRLLHLIKVAHDAGLHVLFLSLDIDGAFNNAWWPAILEQLRQKGCPENLQKLVSSYFTDRTVTYEGKTFTDVRHLSKGCPQGSVSGPGFWNILFDDLLSLDFDDGTEALAYADDLDIVVTGRTREDLERAGSKALDTVADWGEKYRLKFNPQKTKGLVIGKNVSLKRRPTLRMKGHRVSCFKSVKCLGVIIDEQLSWSPHIASIQGKVRCLAYRLMNVAKAYWGIGSTAMRQIYIGAVEPLILYASLIWGHVATSAHNCRKLRSIQRMMLLRITKAYSTTSNDALCVMARVIPIHLRIGEQLSLHTAVTDGTVELPAPHLSLGHPATRTRVNRVIRASDTSIQIYTDGSKSASGVGAAFHATDDGVTICDRQFKLNVYNSVFQAELLAVSKAVEWATEALNHRHVDILTDNLSVINELQKRQSSNRTVIYIKQLILASTVTFTTAKIKSHDGIHGNEVADGLARQAASLGHLPLEPVQQPKSSVKTDLRRQTIETWQSDWSSSETGRLTFAFFPSVTDRMYGDTSDVVVGHNLSQLVTGHGSFGAYLQRFRRGTQDPTCPCGYELEDVAHILYDCPLTPATGSALREALRQLPQPSLLTQVWTPDTRQLFAEFADEVFAVRRQLAQGTAPPLNVN